MGGAVQRICGRLEGRCAGSSPSDAMTQPAGLAAFVYLGILADPNVQRRVVVLAFERAWQWSCSHRLLASSRCLSVGQLSGATLFGIFSLQASQVSGKLIWFQKSRDTVGGSRGGALPRVSAEH